VLTEFYTTDAQVMPVLLLALLWDSGFLRRVREQPRLSRRISPDGVRFWTKPRVRAYSLFVASVMVLAIAADFLVLGNLVSDTTIVRWGEWLALALALGTLLFRLAVDILVATAVDTSQEDTIEK